MKKFYLFTIALFIGLKTFATKPNIQYGLNMMLGTNYSEFSGGSDIAHAAFYKRNFGTGALNFNARYFINDHWSLQSGLGFSSIGFEFGFAKNYSLIKNDHFIKSSTKIDVTQIPLIGIYNFTPDCKKKSWLIGAGFNFMFSSESVNNVIDPADTKSETYMLPQLSNYQMTITSKKFSTTNLLVMIGREKKFSKGNRLSLNFIVNLGLAGDIAQTKVNYTLDGTDYEHKFSNQGHYAGLSVAYLFSSKASRAKTELLNNL